MYEGKPVKTPDAGAFWRVIAQHKVKTLFTAPAAIRAIREKTRKENFLSNMISVISILCFSPVNVATLPLIIGWKICCSAR
jgi:acyl-coenzyme A synthetase/AMP-(fatty) acid ligase